MSSNLDKAVEITKVVAAGRISVNKDAAESTAEFIEVIFNKLTELDPKGSPRPTN